MNDSFEATLKKHLTDNGMSDKDAASVFDRFKSVNDTMDGRWQDRTADYPSGLLTVLLLGIRQSAVCWIDETCPRAWFRPMFVDFDTTPSAGEKP